MALLMCVYHCCGADTFGRCYGTDRVCNWCGTESGAYSFSPGVFVLLQLALVHLHVPQALAPPPR